MKDAMTGKVLPNRIEGRGFIILPIEKSVPWGSNAGNYKILVYSAKKCYLIEEGNLVVHAPNIENIIGKHVEGKCFINMGTERINITNHSLDDPYYVDYQGVKRYYKPSRWHRTFFKRGQKITEITEDVMKEIAIQSLIKK